MKLKNVVLPFTLVAAFLTLSTFVHAQYNNPTIQSNNAPVALSLSTSESLTIAVDAPTITFSSGDSTNKTFFSTPEDVVVAYNLNASNYSGGPTIWLNVYFPQGYLGMVNGANTVTIPPSDFNVTWTSTPGGTAPNSGQVCTMTLPYPYNNSAYNCAWSITPVSLGAGTFTDSFTMGIASATTIPSDTYTGVIYIQASAL